MCTALLSFSLDSASTTYTSRNIVESMLVSVVGASGFVFLRRRLRPSMPPTPPLSKEDAERVRSARKQSKT